MGRKLAVELALVALLVLAAFAAWHPVLDLELLGWDSYPLIEAGRMDGPLALLGEWREELMDGRYPFGRFYRPLVHASFGIDRALWGLAPRGYHLTDLLIACAAAWALASLARRAFGAGAALGAIAAALVFLLHPRLIDVLPSPARRADALAFLFTVLALRSAASETRWAQAGTFLSVFLACSAKETGALAALLIPIWAALQARGARALRASWPAWAAVALYLGARALVLGGWVLGGSAKAGLPQQGNEFMGTAARHLRDVLPGLVSWPLFLGCFVLAAGLLALRKGAGRSSEQGALVGWRGGAFLLAWLTLLSGLTALSGVERSWYTLPFLGVWSLFLAWSAPRRNSGRRLEPLAWGVWGVLVLTHALAVGSQGFSEERAASRNQAQFLERCAAAVRGARDGTRVRVDGCPLERTTKADGTSGRKVSILSWYSVQSWANLTFPERTIRVVRDDDRTARPPAARELVLELTATKTPAD
jgi:hypothetical protein